MRWCAVFLIPLVAASGCATIPIRDPRMDAIRDASRDHAFGAVLTSIGLIGVVGAGACWRAIPDLDDSKVATAAGCSVGTVFGAALLGCGLMMLRSGDRTLAAVPVEVEAKPRAATAGPTGPDYWRQFARTRTSTSTR